MTTDALKIAVVGAGPAGIYAADILLKAATEHPVSIDLFEQLPAPYGLVRYGVAPDHPRIKGIITALREVLDRGEIRIFGNVHYGRDITLRDLKQHYHAVIFATGAIRDADLAVPGIDAEGSYGAADFVNWFDGHPDVPRTWPLEAKQIAVVGNGNVALDITRMLVKHVEDLQSTEIPDNVYRGLAENPVEEVHVFGRRGPKQVKFTPLELRELGQVRDVDMVLDEADFAITNDVLEALPTQNKQVLVMTRIFDQWRQTQRAREAGEAPAGTRRVVWHFWSKPLRVETEGGRVTGITVQRTRPDAAGGVVDTDETVTIPVQALYRAVGYYGSALDDIPFDADRGVVPNAGGRVVDGDTQVDGVYVTGWIKRGPVGLIGATKSDASETVQHLLEDAAAGRLWQPTSGAGEDSRDAIPRLLASRGVTATDLEGWHRLDAHELELGATDAHPRERVKVVPREEMVRISRGERS